jgi:hypothetical protein
MNANRKMGGLIGFGISEATNPLQRGPSSTWYEVAQTLMHRPRHGFGVSLGHLIQHTAVANGQD